MYFTSITVTKAKHCLACWLDKRHSCGLANGLLKSFLYTSCASVTSKPHLLSYLLLAATSGNAAAALVALQLPVYLRHVT